ncbi:MAG: DctP family TRAP transporter solute-binding subunit [Bacillota bacterium]|nr:DctP family TRAP transporter solute-binding subunit [Bacillota bacterium]
MRKKLALILVGILMLALLVGCSQPADDTNNEPEPAEPVSVNLAVGDPIHSSVGVTAEYFARRVAEETDGRVEVTVFPDGTLFGGDQNAAVSMLEDGSLDAMILSTSVFASFEKKMNAISLPYLFSGYDEFVGFLEGEPGQELLASFDNQNSKGLALMIRTFRSVTNSRGPIAEPADLEGLKLRVPNNKLWVEFFGPMGADPTPMDFGEVYTSLQLGTIHGQENPVEVPLANKFYEVQDYLSLTNHIADAYALVFNKDLWDSFDAETQEILERVALETAQFKLDSDLAEEEEVIAELEEKGMQVNRLTEEQVAAFQEAALELYPKFEELVGKEFMEKTLDFLGR